jgi:hypothetical protein
MDLPEADLITELLEDRFQQLQRFLKSGTGIDAARACPLVEVQKLDVKDLGS